MVNNFFEGEKSFGVQDELEATVCFFFYLFRYWLSGGLACVVIPMSVLGQHTGWHKYTLQLHTLMLVIDTVIGFSCG